MKSWQIVERLQGLQIDEADIWEKFSDLSDQDINILEEVGAKQQLTAGQLVLEVPTTPTQMRADSVGRGGGFRYLRSLTVP